MRRVISGLLIMSLCISLSGCVPAQKVSADGEVKNMDAAVANFFELMDKDKPNNEQSVFWDGTEARMIDDDQDSKDVDDGRYYRGCVYLEKELWSTNIYGMEGRQEVENTEKHVLFKGASWQFEVTMIDNFDEGVAKLESEDNLRLCSEDIGEKTFLGIRDINGRRYAGYATIKDDLFGHVYEISYFGTGNMEDIGVMASQVKNQFTINFEEKEAEVLSN